MMFIRNESFSTFVHRYPVVTTLAGLNIIIHLWVLFLPYGAELYRQGVGANFLISTGEYWRLLTPIFLHSTQSLFHLLFNTFSLVIFAPALEIMLGRFKFLAVYLLAGVVANIATFLLETPMYTHVGASGAIFGLFGVYLYMFLARKDLLDTQNSQLVLTILAISVVMTFVSPQINILGHLFGLAGGLILAPLFTRNAKPFYAVRHTSRKTYLDEDDISFKPNRWKNRARNQKVIRIVLIVIAVLIAIGIYTRLNM
ncbi:rhomboid family intramembrane serine protease [Shouchella lonarensis]|uniref:Membrane associated serine protease, rhomboid family n=1 Tax=Shouchella lonarensis TaxID=1464122 RepID=A0A1G6MXR7_9BACI|nr:Membrane associated serine protease, rhomboid family [Shouchella lonarensis]